MATIQQIKCGISQYIDSEILPHLSGARRFGAAMYVALAMDGIDSQVHELLNAPAIRVLGLSGEDGQIDIDKLHAAAIRQISKEGKIDVDIPVVGRFAFSKMDIDKLYDIINKS